MVMNGDFIVPASPHYLRWADYVGGLLVNNENPSAGELGGGIGLCAYFMLRDIPNLSYTNYDLPLVLAVNQFFLMHALPDQTFRLYGEGQTANIELLPHWSIEHHFAEFDVFLNFHSLSEMRRETVNNYLGWIGTKTKEWFLHENSGDAQQGYNQTPTPYWDIPNSFKLVNVTPNMWGETTYKEYLYKKVI